MEEDNLDKTTEEDNLNKTTEEDNLNKTTEEDNLDKITEEENLAKTTEEENLAKTTEEENLAKRTEEDNLAKTTEEDNLAKAMEDTLVITRNNSSSEPINNCSSEAIEFSKTLVNNVHVYYIQSSYTIPGEYSFCKLYSDYCHAVVCHFFYENSDIFENELKDSTAYQNEADLMNLIRNRYKEWFVTEKNPPDSQYFIICAKIAVLEISVSQHNTSIIGQSEKIIANIAQRAINFGILKENYDDSRNDAKSLVNSVYRWLNADVKKYATEPDNELGWKETSLSKSEMHFLERDGWQLLIRWKFTHRLTQMNRQNFIDLMFYLYDKYVKTSNNSTQVKSFVLALSVLSAHCSAKLDFFDSTEIVIDIATRRLEGNVFNNFKLNEYINIQ